MRSLHQLHDNGHRSKYPPHLVFIVVLLVSTGFSGKMRLSDPLSELSPLVFRFSGLTKRILPSNPVNKCIS